MKPCAFLVAILQCIGTFRKYVVRIDQLLQSANELCAQLLPVNGAFTYTRGVHSDPEINHSTLWEKKRKKLYISFDCCCCCVLKTNSRRRRLQQLDPLIAFTYTENSHYESSTCNSFFLSFRSEHFFSFSFFFHYLLCIIISHSCLTR